MAKLGDKKYMVEVRYYGLQSYLGGVEVGVVGRIARLGKVKPLLLGTRPFIGDDTLTYKKGVYCTFGWDLTWSRRGSIQNRV